MMVTATALCFSLSKGGAAKGFSQLLDRLPFSYATVTCDNWVTARFLYCRLVTVLFKVLFRVLTPYSGKLSSTTFALRHQYSNSRFLILGWCANHILHLSSRLENYDYVYIRASDEWWHSGLQHFADSSLEPRFRFVGKYLAYLDKRELKKKIKFFNRNNNIRMIFPSVWMRDRFLSVHKNFPLSQCFIVRNSYLDLQGVVGAHVGHKVARDPVKIAFISAELFDKRKKIDLILSLPRSLTAKLNWAFIGQCSSSEAITLKAILPHAKVHGFLKGDDVIRALSTCTYILHAADVDNSPNGLIEAMSFGLIPICTKSGGAIEYIPKSSQAFCFENDNALGSLAAVLDSIVNESDLFSREEYAAQQYYSRFVTHMSLPDQFDDCFKPSH